MCLTKEVRAEISRKYAGSETSTGSAGGQIALSTLRINRLTEHLEANRKGFNTECSLVKLVSKCRGLLDYLKDTDTRRYRAIIKELNARR